MAASLVGGAAVGAVFGELLKAVLEVKARAAMFKSSLTRLQITLESISPLIEDLSRFNDELGRSPEEIVRLIKEMEEGTKLVCQCSNINWWNYLTRSYYSEQLMALENSIVRFFYVNMQAQIARDQKETLLEVRKIHDKIVERLVQGKLAEPSTAAAQLHLLDSKISRSKRKEGIEAVGPSMVPP